MEYKIEYMKTGDLVPYENNPRQNENAVEAVAESLKRFGFINPVVIDKNNIIAAGHTRIKAAELLGIEQVPCIRAEDLSEEQIKAFRLADNKTAELAAWDKLKLSQELTDIANLDMTAFGFEEADWGTAIDDVKEDDAPELSQEEPTTKEGDLFKLGDHLLLCGDSTNPEDIAMLLDGQAADMVITDPPYNVDYEEKEAGLLKYRPNARAKSGVNVQIKNDSMTDAEFLEFTKKFCKTISEALKPGGAFYVFIAQGKDGIPIESAINKTKHLKFIVKLVWVKNHFSLSRSDYQLKHEPCIYGTKDGAPHYFINDRTQTSTFEIPDEENLQKMTKAELVKLVKSYGELPGTAIFCDKPLRSGLHPTMKPVKLYARFIKNSSKTGETVLDIFGGSGTAVIACEQLHRRARVIELDPHYCDVIIKRWEEYTGKKRSC